MRGARHVGPAAAAQKEQAAKNASQERGVGRPVDVPCSIHAGKDGSAGRTIPDPGLVSNSKTRAPTSPSTKTRYGSVVAGAIPPKFFQREGRFSERDPPVFDLKRLLDVHDRRAAFSIRSGWTSGNLGSSARRCGTPIPWPRGRSPLSGGERPPPRPRPRRGTPGDQGSRGRSGAGPPDRGSCIQSKAVDRVNGDPLPDSAEGDAIVRWSSPADGWPRTVPERGTPGTGPGVHSQLPRSPPEEDER